MKKQISKILTHLLFLQALFFQVDLPENGHSKLATGKSLAEMEKQYITDVLNKTGWRIRGKNGAAEILALKAPTLYSKMKKLGIKRPRPNVDISSQS